MINTLKFWIWILWLVWKEFCCQNERGCCRTPLTPDIFRNVPISLLGIGINYTLIKFKQKHNFYWSVMTCAVTLQCTQQQTAHTQQYMDMAFSILNSVQAILALCRCTTVDLCFTYELEEGLEVNLGEFQLFGARFDAF